MTVRVRVSSTSWRSRTATSIRGSGFGCQHPPSIRWSGWFGREAATGTHRYRISRVESGSLTDYEMRIDGTTITTAYTLFTHGYDVETGLESYDEFQVMPTVSLSSLQFRRWANNFNDWDGKDLKSVTSPMCGKWQSDTGYSAGENTTCV